MPMSVPLLDTAMAARGRRSSAATRFRRRVHVNQNRPSWATKFMYTPTASPVAVAHMKTHSVWRSSRTCSRSSDSENIDTSS